MFAAIAFVLLAGLPEDEPPVRVAIQPLGVVSAKSLSAVNKGIVRVYNVELSVLQPVSLPLNAYYRPRNRYRAEKLLDYLRERKTRAAKVIGVTASDISTTKDSHYDWGLFGLGDMPGKACVTSSFRLKRKGPKTPDQRLVEVAIHELGHTFGLDHCPTAKCVMADAEGTIKMVDASTGRLCQNCRGRLGAIVRP